MNQHDTQADYTELLKGYYQTDRALLQLIESYNFTTYEMVVCFFYCKQVSLKNIAFILKHSYDSVKKAKQRISKKLKLTDKNIDINEHILKILFLNTQDKISLD